MTGATRCAEARELLGVYVLGAIDPADRALVDTHLRTCRRCRDELASLAGLPALLGHVTEDQLAQIAAPPPEPLHAVLREVHAEHRSRQRLSRALVAVAAAAVVVMTGAGVLGGMRIAGDERPGPATTRTAEPGEAEGRTLVGTDPVTGVKAWITMRPEDWGTAFTVRLTGVPPGARCRLVAVGRDGRRDIAGGWQVSSTGYTGDSKFQGSSMIPSNRITSVELRTVEGTRLLAIRP